MNDKIWQWVGDYCTNSLPYEEEQELHEWLEESEANKQYFSECVRMVREYRIVSSVEMDREIVTRWLRTVRARERKRKWRRYGVAASVVLLLGMSVMLLKRPSDFSENLLVTSQIPAGSTKATLRLADGVQVDLTQEHLKEVMEQYGMKITDEEQQGLRYDCRQQDDGKVEYHTISVPIGGEYRFTLADGTRVWLNSASRMIFPTRFAGKRREVTIEGEVYFDVRPDEDKPFIVRVKEMNAEVLGTKFCISAYPENAGIMTTLVEGAVKVTAGMNQIILQPGYQALVDPVTSVISQKKVTLSLYVSWVEGIFEYENMKLSDIAAQLSRWYDVRFTFSAPEYKERRFTGVVKKYMDLREVLDRIGKTTDVKFIVDGNNVIICALN